MPKFKISKEAIEDGSPKRFAQVRGANGSTLVGRAGETVDVLDEPNVHLTNPLLVPVDKTAKELVARSKPDALIDLTADTDDFTTKLAESRAETKDATNEASPDAEQGDEA